MTAVEYTSYFCLTVHANNTAESFVWANAASREAHNLKHFNAFKKKQKKKHKKERNKEKHVLVPGNITCSTDNREHPNRVWSGKVRGTERSKNIQFNFKTVPAQCTNTKASLRADPRLKAGVNSPSSSTNSRRGVMGVRVKEATRGLLEQRT